MSFSAIFVLSLPKRQVQLMMTRAESLENFKLKMKELEESRYILADGKVGEVLRAIAGSRMLYALFEHVTENFDYATFKSVCFADNGDGSGCFTLPKRDEDVLALVFLLLIELDNKQEDIYLVSEKYFPADSKQASYDKFMEQAIKPFGEIVEKTAYMLINAENLPDDEPEQPAPKPVEEPKPESVKAAKMPTKAELIIIEQTENARRNAKLNDDEKEELVFVLEKLAEAVGEGDEENIAVAFIALKYMTKIVKKSKTDVDAIAAALSEARK